MSEFGVRGTEALIKGLRKNADLNDVKNVVKLNGSEMQRAMQRDSPVDTGFFKRNIKYYAEDDGFTARVVPEAEYAKYLIYGTRYMYPRDFFSSNYYSQRQKFLTDMKRLMK